jgi:exodeoxyribonuclease III
MRFATWNVNSIRTRVDRVVAFLDRTGTDVIAMQETKCRPDQFPIAEFESAGYQVVAHGLDQWNGVAIASRVGLVDVEVGFPGQPTFGKPGADPVAEARALGATCAGLRVWSVYVPNGRALDDPHFAYKAAFLNALRAAAGDWATGGVPVAIAGDWNVAPFDTDIWDPLAPENATHVSPEVRKLFLSFADVGYVDVTLLHVPDEHRYTFWDYQRLRFPRGEGMRIDFVYASASLATRVTFASIDRDERKGSGASDHAPVIVDFLNSPGTVVS